MLVVSSSTLQYNIAVMNHNVRMIVRYMIEHDQLFVPVDFFEYMAKSVKFPHLSVRQVIEGVKVAGSEIYAKMITPGDLPHVKLPFIAIMKGRSSRHLPTELIRIEKVENNDIFACDDFGDNYKLPVEEFYSSFTGIVLLTLKRHDLVNSREIVNYDCMHILQSAVNHQVLESLLTAFYKSGFVENKQSEYHLGRWGEAGESVIGLGYRAFLDVDEVPDDCLPIIKFAQGWLSDCDTIEGVACLKLPVGHSFPPTFDSGVNLNRVLALHFPFNKYKKCVSFYRMYPRQESHLSIGDALIISCGDKIGRVSWNTEWSFKPLECDTTYIITVWFRGRNHSF